MTRETPIDECHLEYNERDTSGDHLPGADLNPRKGNVLHFAASWTYPYIEDFCEERGRINAYLNHQPDYVIHLNEINSRFGILLKSHGTAESRIEEVLRDTGFYMSIMLEQKEQVGFADLKDINAQQLQPGEAVPPEVLVQFPRNHERIFPNGKVALSYVNIDRMWLGSYYRDLEQELCGVDSAFSSFKMNEVEIRLFHQHLLLEGVWKQQDFDQAELILSDSAC